MSIENGERMLRRLRADSALRQKILKGGAEGFLGVSAAAGASASAYDVIAALATEIDQQESRKKKLVLVGLVEPKSEAEAGAFNSWYLGNHIEDTFNCPNITSVRCFKTERGFLGKSPSQFLTIYEFEGDDAEKAEQILGAYQADPKGWDKRLPNNNSMAIVGAGWYAEAVKFEGKEKGL